MSDKEPMLRQLSAYLKLLNEKDAEIAELRKQRDNLMNVTQYQRMDAEIEHLLVLLLKIRRELWDDEPDDALGLVFAELKARGLWELPKDCESTKAALGRQG